MQTKPNSFSLTNFLIAPIHLSATLGCSVGNIIVCTDREREMYTLPTSTLCISSTFTLTLVVLLSPFCFHLHVQCTVYTISPLLILMKIYWSGTILFLCGMSLSSSDGQTDDRCHHKVWSLESNGSRHANRELSRVYILQSTVYSLHDILRTEIFQQQKYHCQKSTLLALQVFLFDLL